MASHLLDTDGKKIRVTGFLETVEVVSVMPIKDEAKNVFLPGTI